MRLGVENGFLWYFCNLGAEGADAVIILEGSAIEALVLGLVAEEELPGIGAYGHALKALGEGEVAILGAGDFDIAIADEVGGHLDEALVVTAEGVIEAGGEEAAFEAGGAEEGLAGDGDALEGEELFGVDGFVGGDEVGAQVGDLMEVFEADDVKVGGGEDVFAGVLGRSGLALGGAGSGGAAGVGSVGSELAVGDLLRQ